jgi:hypothetical protein
MATTALRQDNAGRGSLSPLGEVDRLIGGVDVNLLASGTEEEVRTRVRRILKVCGTGGGYVLGTGNSVAGCIHFPNYLALLEEGRKWNSANFGPEY